METIREAGARFQLLSEPWANTTSHAGKLIMTVFASIAEFERDLIGERTSAGRQAARRRDSLRAPSKAQHRAGRVHTGAVEFAALGVASRLSS
jgi:DNA invertase Pin-like site-specific DNA recombinase